MRCRTAGFTLIEMMVTLLVLAILTSIGFQSYQPIVTNIRMSGRINALLATLALARSEAMKRGQTVSVCPSTSTTDCLVSTSWTAGWVVLSSAATPAPLQISSALTNRDTLTSNSIAAIPYPTFTSTGYTFFSDMLTLSERTNNPALRRCIVFSAGSWTVQRGTVCLVPI